jgi:hypothetical protein
MSKTLWIILAFIVVVAVGGYLLTPTAHRPFSIGTACQPWTTLPGPITCTSDADCLTHLAGDGPADPNMALRCNAGTCEGEIYQCVVNP